MAISFVGSSNVSNGLAQGTSAVVPKPGGVVNGDFLLAFVSIGNTGAITAPAGWAEVPLGTNTAPNLQNRIYWKVASGEPASWTWTFSSAAYVGICHATRGVSHVFSGNQNDDGLSLLSHTTPVIAAPANAWLVSSWTARNLLALGWSPPAGDTERQDAIGGLLILLNVNHAVDDTNAPVAAGNYSKTANTLTSVRALDGIVALAPVLDPLTVVALDFKALVSAPTVGLGLVGAALDLSVLMALAVMGPVGIVGAPVDSAFVAPTATLTPGEVFLDAVPFDGFYGFGADTLTPGLVTLGASPILLAADVAEPEIIPGEVTVFAEPIPTSFGFTGDEMIVLGYLISNETPLVTSFDHPGFLLGLQISSSLTPFLVPPINTVNTYLRFPNPPMGAVVYVIPEHGGVCCPA
jgi:hypothetical protein